MIDNKTESCCVYCGDWYQCRDHVTPISWQQVYRDYKSATVKCCTLCNTLAGSFVAFSIIQKAEFLSSRYRKKYKKVIRLPHWSNSELDELDYTLKTHVKQQQNLKKLILSKLENLDRVAAGFQPIKLNDLGQLEVFLGGWE